MTPGAFVCLFVIAFVLYQIDTPPIFRVLSFAVSASCFCYFSESALLLLSASSLKH